MRRRKILISLIIIITVIITIVGYTIYYFFFSLSHLPEGKFLKQVHSPDKTYTIKIFLVNGGATTSYAIRGELINNKNHTAKNIYWEYRTDHADVTWINNDTVLINGHNLNVKKDTYDWRRG